MPDLQDCYEHLSDLLDDEEAKPEELEAAYAIVRIAQRIVDEYGG
jgi:hypothetical protein